jgi:hypothetical protein
MASNFPTDTFSSELIKNAGVWHKFGSAGTWELLGATIEGITFTQNAVYDETTVDGQFNSIEGEHRILSERPTFTGKLASSNATLLLRLLPGASSTISASPLSGTLTPGDGGSFFGTGSYLTSLRVVREAGAGHYVHWTFPRALVRMGDVAFPADNGKVTYDFSALGVQSASSAASNMYTRVWSIGFSSAATG